MKTSAVFNIQPKSDFKLSDLDISIRALVYMVIMREGESANHMLRIQGFVKTLAKALQTHPQFASFFNNEHNIDFLTMAAPLRDIGNTGIPDRILLKPGPLTSEEFAIIKKHPQLGLDIIRQVENDLGKTTPLTVFAKEIAYNHHERWDGSGYPNAIFGEEIPFSARVVMIADVYDALVSRRVYKPKMPHLQAVKIILNDRGKMFDPAIVDVFETIHEEFHSIAAIHADTEKDFKKKIDYLEQAICVEP